MAQPLLRSAGIVSAAVFLSRITGVVRETLMARLFGAGQVYDAFLMGMRIPNLARDLFAEGALSAAFVPVFTRYLSTRGKREAAELSNLVATALTLVVGGVCVVGIVFTPEVVRIVAPGFERVPETADSVPFSEPVPALGGKLSPRSWRIVIAFARSSAATNARVDRSRPVAGTRSGVSRDVW